MADENLELDQIFPGTLAPESSDEGEKAAAEPARRTKAVGADEMLLQDIDSGRAFEEIVNKYTARIRQLKAEIASYRKENNQITDENLIQNLELIIINQNLEKKVKERTRELELSNLKLEQQARQLLELSATKESLTHMIVHDMKNPLTAMLGTLRLFTRQSFGLPDGIHKMLIGADNQGRQLLNMMEQMLMISRMQTREFQLKTETADLVALIRRCLSLMEGTLDAKRVVFRFDPPLPALPATVDIQVIERVINNLINNAIKYAPQDSEVPVEIDRVRDEALIRVTNWGEAIPARYHEKIFELFCRANPQEAQFAGTGLGLTFCKLAVEAHHGRLSVNSPVPAHDRGARFNVVLPLEPPRSVQTDTPPME